MVPSASVVIRLLEIAFWDGGQAASAHPCASPERDAHYFLKNSLALQARRSDESWCAEIAQTTERKGLKPNEDFYD